MKKSRIAGLVASVLMAFVVAGADAGASRPAASVAPSSLAAAFQRGSAWSVGIYMFVAGDDEPRVGAGFLIDDKGSVATAAHLLGEAQQILVALPDKRLVAAEVEGQDAESDIALLRISPAPRVHPVLAKAGSLRVGDWVMAIGDPFGLERSASVGIVSGMDRHFGDDGELLFIQSDVALNPGNSGGPLLDATGGIVGMNARTIVGPVGTPGASLAIPIDIVRQIVSELRGDNALPARPRLGALFDDVPPLTAWAAGRGNVSGALILSVPRGTLAERLQLHAGDIVTMMNGQPITGGADLVNVLLAWRGPAQARVVVQRGGRELLLRLD